MNSINEIFLEDELIESYLSYAMSVIIGRALPDVRDGLKPVHRRTLFVMKELNNKFNKPHKKSARIVGDIIGKYHPHSEMAVYDSIVRLSQTFVQRYPLIDGQGNFGSIDGDPAAAMRYTEIKMAEISEYILKDLDFLTVDYIFNYDNTEKYPVIFPSMFPNILINGSYGIAVGMATNIPPHNLTEIINGCLAYIQNKDISITELNNYILSPDFPTNASVHGLKYIHEAYIYGKGNICIKSKPIIKIKVETPCILITELPYQVNKIKLLIKIKDLIKEKRIDEIKFIRDESDKDGLRIFIAIEKNSNIRILLNKLYTLTNLQNTFNVNMLCLVNNIPKLLNLKNIIFFFILHRQEIIYRRIRHIILKIKHKIHLLEALYIILFNTNKVIKLITNINDIKYFKETILNFSSYDFFLKLQKMGFLNTNHNKQYLFSFLQIKFILDLKLSRLVKFEKNVIINNYILFLKDYIYYKLILLKNNIIDTIIKNELTFIKKKFNDKRKTKIFFSSKTVSDFDLIEKKRIIILLSKNAYLNIQNACDYKLQHRAGKGRKNNEYKKHNDRIINMTLGINTDILLCFSKYGKLYSINLYQIFTSYKLKRGILLSNIINIPKDDAIVILKTLNNFKNCEDKYIALATTNGMIKITSLYTFKKIKNNGIKVINVAKNDKLIDIKIINKNDDCMIFSNTGRVIRFSSNKIKITSRKSRGVISIKLNKNENVISLIIPEKNCYILTATKYGYGKRSKIDEYKVTNRGGRGILTHKIEKKIGNVIGVEKVYETESLFMVTMNGIVSKIKIKEVPCVRRQAKGVILIKLRNNEKLINIKKFNEE